MSERALIGLGLLFIGVIVFAKGASDPFSLIQAGIGVFLAVVGSIAFLRK